MLNRLLSHDLPRNRWLAIALVLIVVALALTPFIFPGTKALNVAAKVIVFIVLAASFDLLLGYTGIVSFAHTMFFGIGAYGVAIAATRHRPDLAGARARHRLRARRLARPLARHRPVQPARAGDLLRHDHARRRLGVRDAGVAALRLHRRRGRPDVQGARGAAARHVVPREAASSARRSTGASLTYYLLFFVALGLVLTLLRIVNSPFGRVLQAIRENDFRAEAIGYRTVVYRTLASVVSALFATLAGVLLALWLRYNGPDTTLSFEIMLDVLLIVVIGGMGTIYGAVVGSVLLVLAQNYLQDLLKSGGEHLQNVPVLAQIVSPDRWLLWLGILFVLSVYYFPTGVVGRLRAMRARRARIVGADGAGAPG